MIHSKYALNSYAKSTLHLVLRLRGGAKKRKKKNYTTPKKIKHKHKKVKLPVLKYYKVDDNGKITRQRRECPSEECGAGIFMANMFDRQYCGRCHLTYVFNKPEVTSKQKYCSNPSNFEPENYYHTAHIPFGGKN
ncbi:Ubiquitin-40S ribosomal protein S27a [Armadillidium nasatum]|uniref:Ubiquitin-40S ribosomal protein S27a n=1 Tax=Armadillidium nasatum TaxID=96803 RepID=A0A5N5TCG2_9CRUS|nr:Ubiquitin-40S ribosomal protein S27a [Armadillidium nasatum]